MKTIRTSIGRSRLMKPKNLILKTLLVGAMVTMLSSSLLAAGPLPQDQSQKIADTFSILLQGPYKSVVHGPDLGLTTVDLSDGSYSKTKIYHLHGKTQKPIGTFYVQFDGMSVAYDLPGGAIAMVFTAIDLKPIPDGQGGTYLIGTGDLDITEATGVYQSFVGGHNKMVDILHQLADGTFVEHCICIISRKV
ncbi:MAG: hypothetical protein DMG80_17645 [Acidobacteria bacterium]|nr:MAG: hypothetical protein DMG80_17645 [Acidobacteriota bacterium]